MRKPPICKTGFYIALLAACAGNAFAHHSVAAFDMSVVRDVQGTVTDVSWRNPHVYLTVETIDPNGKTISRLIEAGPPSVLLPRGVTANSIHRGDRVIVRASPNRNSDDRAMLGIELRQEDGTRLPLHALAMKALPIAATAETIAGNWVPRASGMMEMNGQMRGWPLTAKARAVSPERRAAITVMRGKCIPFTQPALMALPVLSTVTVTVREVVFTLDWMNVRRRVALDRGAHPAKLAPSVFGDSIGHWESGTLVVDTVGFVASPEGMGFELPSSAAKHVVERFSLSPDRHRLIYEVTVEDREMLEKPVSYRTEWDYRPDVKMSGLPCDGKVAARYAKED